jgi:hypothetical protein
MCVLFCVSRLNMQPSRMSVNRTSPLEQFTGRKIDAARDLRVQFGDYVQATVSESDDIVESDDDRIVRLTILLIRWVELHEHRCHDAIQFHVYFDTCWRHVCVEECTPNIDRNDLATLRGGYGCYS